MLGFKNYIELAEGDTTAAYDMEKVIVAAAGGTPFESKLIPNSPEVGKKIVSTLKLRGTGKFPKNIYPPSKKWNQYFPGGAKGSTLTPKTDLIIGTKRVSLKTGNAQLMSGGVNEAAATFYVAAEQSGQSLDNAVSTLGQHIENLLPATDMQKLGIKGNKTDLEKTGKFIEVEILRKADEAHHAFKNDLRKVFNSNPDFAKAFTFEAMTGQIKFDNNEGTSDYFLVTDYKGNAQGHTVISMDDPYVKKISKQVKPDVKFKSSSIKSAKSKSAKNPKGKTGYYKFWSVVGLNVKMVVEEEIKNADLLTEGVFDVLKRALNKAKSWLKSFWARAKQIISQSWHALIDFMDLQPDVKFNNNINW